MKERTLTRADIVDAINREVGLTHCEAVNLLESVLGHISDALVRGESVKLSSFATFELLDKTERPGRNPKTMEDATIGARRVVRFRASQLMKERISAGCSRQP